MKYYRAITRQYPSQSFIDKYGEQHDNQYIIICKANTITEANKISADLGFNARQRTFNITLTNLGLNNFDIAMCDKLGGFIVSTDGVVGKNFVSIDEFI